MAIVDQWKCLEPDLETILASHPRPLEALSAGEIPCIILRGAYAKTDCRRLIETLFAQAHLYDPAKPVPAKFLQQSIPEGFYRKGTTQARTEGFHDDGSTPKRRIDIGTSLGYRGSDKEGFLLHSEQTHRLFEQIFDGLRNPIDLIYETLSALAPGKRAVTAHEPDGRKYGPAIIRAHYGGYTYKPHVDSVRYREERTNYAVRAFDHQFAGVLVLQNTERDGHTAQCILHRRLWSPDLDGHLKENTFHEYATEAGIEQMEVHLEPGDLYFFNTLGVHEVPGVDGVPPRVVLATFIGYSSDKDEIFVWS